MGFFFISVIYLGIVSFTHLSVEDTICDIADSAKREQTMNLTIKNYTNDTGGDIIIVPVESFTFTL